MILYMLRGLPGSGKTTHAKKMVVLGVKRVNRDELRDMLDNGVFSVENESLVKRIQDYAVLQALWAGYDVVLDNCNHKPEDEAQWRQMADSQSITFVIIDMKTSLEECIRRDALREHPVGKAAIESMSRLESNPATLE